MRYRIIILWYGDVDYTILLILKQSFKEAIDNPASWIENKDFVEDLITDIDHLSIYLVAESRYKHLILTYVHIHKLKL